MSPYNRHEEPRLGHNSTGLGEATLERHGSAYTLTVAGITVRVALNRSHPHSVTVSGQNFDAHVFKSSDNQSGKGS